MQLLLKALATNVVLGVVAFLNLQQQRMPCTFCTRLWSSVCAAVSSFNNCQFYCLCVRLGNTISLYNEFSASA